jgi:hypothetical protein
MRNYHKVHEEIAAEKKANAAIDPREKLIGTFKNTLELALRTDKLGEREAAFAALVRLVKDMDLDFLDRISDAGRDKPLQPTMQITDTASPLDWFLNMSPEQLRKQAEQHAERQPDWRDELHMKISTFLNTLRKAAQKETTQQSQPMAEVV